MENKPNGLITIVASLMVLVSLCALGTAAMSAAASAANAVAMATMAAALQTSQCTIMLLALAVIVTPVSIIVAVARLNAQAQQYRLPPGYPSQPALPRRQRRTMPAPEETQITAILQDWMPHERTSRR